MTDIQKAARIIRDACINTPNPLWLRDEHWEDVARKVLASKSSAGIREDYERDRERAQRAGSGSSYT